MSLVFQERTDGYRVVRMQGDIEQMLASIQTKIAVPSSAIVPMSNEVFEQRMTAVGMEAALAERDALAKAKSSGITVYEPMPIADCSIHSAVGPLSVADLEEMLLYLSKL